MRELLRVTKLGDGDDEIGITIGTGALDAVCNGELTVPTATVWVVAHMFSAHLVSANGGDSWFSECWDHPRERLSDIIPRGGNVIDGDAIQEAWWHLDSAAAWLADHHNRGDLAETPIPHGIYWLMWAVMQDVMESHAGGAYVDDDEDADKDEEVSDDQ
jgi:hypothetical protein